MKQNFICLSKYFLYLALVIANLGQTWAQQATKDLDINIKFYHLKVALNLDKPHIEGEAKIKFVSVKPNVREFSLDLHGDLEVSSVEGVASFEQIKEENRLLIRMPQTMNAEQPNYEVLVKYAGVPPTEVGSRRIKGLRYGKHGAEDWPVLATACYPAQAKLWFPCRDGFGDKADSAWIDVSIEDRKSKVLNPETKKTVQIPFIALSNGKLAGVDSDAEKGTKTFKWRCNQRIAAHHIFVAVSNFTKQELKFSSGKEKFPINFYFFLENLEQNQAMIARMEEIMGQLVETFGPYPFAEHGISVIETGLDLGAEGISAQANVLLETLKAVHIYRLVYLSAGQWFGNYISPQHWKDLWLFEAIAAYAEAMWQEYKRGLPVRQIILDDNEYFKGGKLHNDNPKAYDHQLLNNKGMYVIHMLRSVMGDNYFFQSLKAIPSLKRKKETYLTTADFQEICEYYAGENIEQDYSYFFKQWVFGEFYPRYKVSYETTKKSVKIDLEQETRTTQPNFFEMPIQIRLRFAGGTEQLHTLRQKQAQQSFELPLSQELISLDFDPENWILKELDYVRHKLNKKTPIEGFEVQTEKGNRNIKISFEATKKQDIQIELIRLANKMIPNSQDESLSVLNLPKSLGKIEQQFKIPLAPTDFGNFLLKISGKSDVYYLPLRVKRLEKQFD